MVTKKEKKDKKNKPQTPYEKMKAQAMSRAEKLQSCVQSLEFQVGLLVVSLTWLGVLVYFLFKLKRLTQNFETDKLRDNPFELINFTIASIASELQAPNTRDDFVERMTSRLDRIMTNSSFDLIITNVSLLYNVVSVMIHAAEQRSQYCDYSGNLNLINNLLNTSANVLNVIQRNLPTCNIIPITKIITQCPGEESVINSSKKLVKSFILSSDNKCPPKIAKGFIKLLNNTQNYKDIDQILSFVIEDSELFEKSSKEICDLAVKHQDTEYAFTRKTKDLLCKAYSKFKCPSDEYFDSSCPQESDAPETEL
ncbi:hypothetical protein TVAG_368900 [Trichomonas vaginalis G3]|uniref:Uncharacterized protein n=1 Tax=Trichomonas vaginalis (strain ATCC PRA-98 / G3) TaxID=412133 RepID=A2EUZ6_TRIV3|nr:hypothetical protein TVAGG3_0441540 [Trichomonas vaginalis G3]EAY03519.1 hypothetical protein TVAG_368900 [Trichomonas vaginalis G3]KAI5537491.1 hypothetical protein TVAGG3_0441540 [Trichomonas vaginalis G3]|eukprot:XP_001315742.1 hypothetical protein [Trichomonas vaginalis G3]